MTEQELIIESEGRTVLTVSDIRVQDSGRFGERLGSGKLGTIEQVLAAEAAKPILDSLRESELRHATATRRLGILAKRPY
jgi:hypothetical protein